MRCVKYWEIVVLDSFLLDEKSVEKLIRRFATVDFFRHGNVEHVAISVVSLGREVAINHRGVDVSVINPGRVDALQWINFESEAYSICAACSTAQNVGFGVGAELVEGFL